MTQEEKILDAKEFTSLITSCKLAVAFNKDKPNRAIKHTAKAVRERVQSARIKAVCDNAIKSPFALGWLSHQEQNIQRIGNETLDNFLAIGAALEGEQ